MCSRRFKTIIFKPIQLFHKIIYLYIFRTFANETNEFLAPYEAPHKTRANLSFGPASIASGN